MKLSFDFDRKSFDDPQYLAHAATYFATCTPINHDALRHEVYRAILTYAKRRMQELLKDPPDFDDVLRFQTVMAVRIQNEIKRLQDLIQEEIKS